MSGIYTVLFAMYFLILAVNIKNKKEFANFIRGLLLVVSFVILIASIPLQIWL